MQNSIYQLYNNNISFIAQICCIIHTDYNLVNFKMMTHLFQTTIRIRLGFYILKHSFNVMLKKSTSYSKYDIQVGNIATASSLLFSVGA